MRGHVCLITVIGNEHGHLGADFIVECTCGWSSERLRQREAAEAMLNAHMLAVRMGWWR